MMVMMMMLMMMMTTTMMVDVVVDLNSFICKRPFFAKNNFREFFSTPCFLSRGYGSPSLCCLDALKLNVNSNCASDLGDSQRQIEGHAGIISPGNNKSSAWQVPLTLQRCWAAAWAMGLDGHLLFRHCFRGTLSRKIFCKSTKTSTPWIVLAGGAPLHCKYFKSSVSLPFTIQKVLASPVKKYGATPHPYMEFRQIFRQKNVYFRELRKKLSRGPML